MEANNNKENEKFDDSSKNFFEIMWRKNHFIQIFIGAFFLFLVQLVNIDWCIQSWLESSNDGTLAMIFVSIGLLLPLLISSIVFLKTVQFWNDLKKGKSR